MTDETLLAIDRALESATDARRSRLRVRRKPQPKPAAPASPAAEAAAEKAQDELRGLWWVDLFLAVQFMWGALLFVPGAQGFRIYIRALPYVSSAALLVVYWMRREIAFRPKATGLVAGALLLLAINLLHPTSQIVAGLGQCLLQACIAAPLFWAYKIVGRPKRFERILVLALVMNMASTTLGLLQVYYPDQFMPPQFNTNFTDQYLDSLSFIGSNGRVIYRPPGLSDQPGGAAISGGLSVLLGLGLLFRTRSAVRRALLFVAVAAGMMVIYLTQVRSVLLMVLAGGAVLGVVAIRQRRFAGAAATFAVGGALVVAGFFLATAVGGDAISDRFVNLSNQGVLQTYQQDRGHYLTNTFGELLDQYPLGAGVGRWGIMNTYFGDESNAQSTPIYVEPQLTGWLLDGGIPMWILYGGAVLLTIFIAFEITAARDYVVGELAGLVLPLLVFIAGLGMAGPIFNTQTGILFWFLASALEGLFRPTPAYASVLAADRESTPVGA